LYSVDYDSILGINSNQTTMNENLNTSLTVEAWADIVIKEWVTKAKALGISPFSPLSSDRFIHHVITASNGDPVRVDFAYDYWLNFIEWGVGKGVNIEDRDLMIAAGSTKRRPRQWFSDVFYKQLKILSHLLAEKTSKIAAFRIKTNLTAYDTNGLQRSLNKERSRNSTSVVTRGPKAEFTAKAYDKVRGR